MKNKPSLSKIFLNSMLMVTIISIGLVGCLWTWQQYTAFHQESKDLNEIMLDSHKNLLKIQVQKSVEYIEYSKSLTRERLRASIQDRTCEAHAIASHLHGKWKNEKSPEALQTLVKEALRAMRFNQGRGYFFILNLDGVVQLQADRPGSEGENLLAGPDNHETVMIHREMIDLVTREQEGFYQYDWTRPGQSKGRFSKIAFVKLFRPYNWIIGTGEYLDDFESSVKTDVLRYLETIKFGKDGYLFVTQWDGMDLTGPAKGRNMLGASDANGVKIVQELVRLAKSDGGFLRYVMPKLKGMKPDPKLSYVQGIKDWQWYVGAGIYIDDIEKAITAKQAEMTQKIINSLIKILAVLLGLIVFAYLFAQRASQNATDSFKHFTCFFDKGARKSAALDPGAMKYREFEKLAHSANDMIKARNQARLALMESEKKYRLIVENLNDLIIKLDHKKNIIFASPTYCDLFERTEDTLLNQAFLSLARGEDREAVKKSLNDLDTPPYTSYHEERTFTKSGWRWLAWSNRAILSAQGLPEEYVVVGRDITEKKQAEQTSRENQEWLQSILDAIQAGVIVIDPKSHKIVELNRAALEMIGTTKENIINTICHNHICPSEQGRCPVTDLGMSVEQSDRTLLAADGTCIPILKTVNRTTINGKGYLIESFLDLRDKKKLETQLQQAQKMEAIGTLAGGIAHDFNNILFPILGHTEILLQDLPDDSPVHNRLKKIYAGGIRARDLVKQILTFSRQNKFELATIELQPIVEEALKFIRATIPTTIEICQDINASCGKVKADPTQIHQVVMNLTTNAYHAMAETGGKLAVGLKEVEMGGGHPHPDMVPGRYACLTVSDTGIGMDKELIGKIFDPFFTTKEKGRGTGMGLSVVHGIVDKMKGRIQAVSQAGKGTEFRVYFPVEKTDLDKQNTRTDELLQGHAEKILLVDDEQDVVTMERQVLERLGYQVFPHTGSLEALEAFSKASDQFDLVITDLAMPTMPGDRLAIELLKIRPDIPIILCTGFSETMTQETASSIGIRGFLSKPVAMKKLAQKIRGVLDKKN